MNPGCGWLGACHKIVGGALPPLRSSALMR